MTDTVSEGISRRRATQACLHCRGRKVRCDVVLKGTPCTNCTLDRTPCEVKRRKQRRQYPSNANACEAGSSSLALTPSTLTPAGSYHLPPALLEHHGHGREVVPVQASEDAVTPLSSGTSFTSWSVYSFLKPDTGLNIPEGDISMLQQRGSFSIPVRHILDEFVREYFLHVHPNLPVINEAEFWESYRGIRRGSVSLMLFQAMLFAACSFVSQSSIKSLGFRSTRSARSALYGRAKALYDTETDRNPLSSAQSALLLTYYVAARNANTNSYWLTIAIHHARVIQADRYYRFTDEKAKANALKRIWWCCICRDRSLALGLRRPLQIGAYDFDFTQPVPTTSDFSDEIHRSLVYSADSKRALMQLLCAQCDLAVALTDGLTFLCPRSKAASCEDQERLAGIIDELERWNGKFRTQLDLVRDLGVGHESTVLYTNVLFVHYHSAQLALRNHAIFLKVNHSAGIEDSPQPDEAPSQRNLLKYLPISMAAFITLPLTFTIIATQISRMRTQNNTGAIYTKTMKGLQLQYEGTDEILEHIHRILHLLRLDSGPSFWKAPGGHGHSKRTPSPSPIPRPRQPTGWSDTPTTPIASKEAVDIFDLATCQPYDYVRITWTIDLSLANGRFPENTDFPATLRPAEPTLDLRLYGSVTSPVPSSLGFLLPSRKPSSPRDHRLIELEAPNTNLNLPSFGNYDGPPHDHDQPDDSNDTIPILDSLFGTTSDMFDLTPTSTSENLDLFSNASLPDCLEALAAEESFDGPGIADLWANVVL